VWNWPPAKIFMGDVGSGYVGYVLAVLAVAAARDNATAFLSWLILGGVFLVDATMTLLLRFRRGKSLFQAHRTHAYQKLARRWRSHKRVTIAVVLVNVLWLLPWAIIAMNRPAWAGYATIIGLVPVAMVVMVVGAGRDEDSEV
jgi:Fuc2NAc and GlcNAc transferase